MKQDKDVEVKNMWDYFDDLCKLPRPSKSEEKVIRYLEEFAKWHRLDIQKDHVGNVLICKPASAGYESHDPVILQSHMDMVGEKEPEINHDFEKDPIVQVREDGWIRAEGTTLGADDGIGIAAQLAILGDKTLKHPPIECLFTIDEESGMTGARELKTGFLKGKVMLNLDSEDEGELFIGCAGGIDTIGSFPLEFRKPSKHPLAFLMSIEGFRGGHSGDEIHLSPSNAIKTLNRFLWNADKGFGIRIAQFEGGNMRNAIPREARAVVSIEEKHRKAFEQYFQLFSEIILKELCVYEPRIQFRLEQAENPEFVLVPGKQQKLLRSIYGCPHGVISWHPTIEGLVETSTNLASIRFKQNDSAILTTSQRSSVESAKKDISDRVACVMEMGGALVEHSDGYPGWKPNTDSVILQITRQAYKDLFDTLPKVKAVHAGLECGLILEKYPGLDIISFGPTIRGAHTPKERIDIASTEKFWKLLLRVLEKS